ncbi:BCL2/adenovirus E1B 19 kDa protein-interacting protein 3 [Anopheles funestus]|uniref:BCL2/adenovirus E1B 19 kDa protein-interacting protein 3 n=1 Tax=Anopheles funestus TaxID=62324 RepID=A0A182R5H7_ANOFN|nr:BCL2/adenovirus E1B 19 kDa protein-interacting protein 3 [Anopheles funestus]
MFRTVNLTSDKGSLVSSSSKAAMTTSTSSQLAKMGPEELGESWIELSSNTSSNSGAATGTVAGSGLGNNILTGATTLSGTVGTKSPDRTAAPLAFASVEEYIRLLREAQRDSQESSRITSLRGSPKSPPNSPNTELAATEEDLRNVYINHVHKEGEIVKDTDWVWDWSSRPDQLPPKTWKFEHPSPTNEEMNKPIHAGYSIRQVRVGKNSLFSREFLYSIVLTNVLSLLLGAGIGAWLQKRGLLLTRVSIE